MPMDLPDDVWLDIVEIYAQQGSDVTRNLISNLASTSKRHRRLTVPALYRTLTFRAYGHTKALVQDALATAHKRAQSLQHCDHLLRHVRELNVVGWSTAALSLRDFPESPWSNEGALVVAYNSVTMLVSHMPGLQCLRLLESPITARLHRSAFHNPLLQTLVVRQHTTPEPSIWHDPLEPSIARRIRHLDYGFHEVPEPLSFVYLSHILAHSILDLVSLSIRECEIPHFAAAAFNRHLSLQKLTIREILTFGSKPASALWHLLPSCPDLHVLVMGPVVVDASLPNNGVPSLPPDALQNLESISGPLPVVHMLIPGRPVNTIELTDTLARYHNHRSIEFPLEDILRCFPAKIKKFTSYSGILAFGDLFTFLPLLHTFKNLIELRITIWSSDAAWEKAMSAKKIKDTIGNTLRQLPQLRILHIRDQVRDLSMPTGKCPIARELDPTDRGHPSLEELMFLTGVWVWIHGQGWTYRDPQAID